MPIDHRLVREMLQDPIPPGKWEDLLDAHREFLSSPAGRSWGGWEVLDVAGLPMAVWSGGEGKAAGEQLNLKLGDLTQLDLGMAHLSRAALVGVMAEGVNFRNATLTDSVLTDSFFDGANFMLGKLSGVDFSRSSLRGANFKKALLINADFEGCDLTGANFTGAKLEGAKFAGAVLDNVTGYSLPIFDGADAAQELKTVATKFDGWRMGQRLEELSERVGRDVFLKTLVEALREGSLPFGTQQELWKPFTEEDATATYTAADYLRLINLIAEVAGPKGRIPFKSGGGYSMLWSDNEVPGKCWTFSRILDNKRRAQDAAFFATLVDRYAELPSPYDQGLASSLIEYGLLGGEALPDDHLDEAATRWLTGDDETTPAPWPEQTFAAKAIEIGLTDAVTSIEPRLLVTLAPHATLGQIVPLAEKSPAGSSLFDAVDAVVDAGDEDEAAARAWEQSVRSVTLGPPDENGRQRGAFPVLAMLSACAGAGREPAGDLDAQLIRFVQNHRPPFFGGGFQDFNDRLRHSFDVLSLERRERLVLAAGNTICWQLYPIAPTAKVAEAIAQRLATMPKLQREAPDWMDQRDFEARLIGTDPGMYGDGCLHALGPALIEPFTRALANNKAQQRLILVAALAGQRNVTALSGLLIGLGDKTKKVSDIAREGLLALPTNEVLTALPDALAARKKSERLAAAQLLLAMRKSKTRTRLAQARLAKEKVADVREVLEAAAG